MQDTFNSAMQMACFQFSENGVLIFPIFSKIMNELQFILCALRSSKTQGAIAHQRNEFIQGKGPSRNNESFSDNNAISANCFVIGP